MIQAHYAPGAASYCECYEPNLCYLQRDRYIKRKKKTSHCMDFFFKKVIEKDLTSRGERGTKRIVHRSLKIRRTVLRFVMLTETFFRCSLLLTLRILSFFFLQSSQIYFIFWVLLSRSTIKIDNGNEVGLAVGVFPLCGRFPP